MKVFTKKLTVESLSAGNVKVTIKALKSATKEVYDKLNTTFDKIFGVSFAIAQTSVPELKCSSEKVPC